MTFIEVHNAMERLQEMLNPNALTKYGFVKDTDMENEVIVTIIATGYNKISRLERTQESNELKLIKDNEPSSIGLTSQPITKESEPEIDSTLSLNEIYSPEKDSIYEVPPFMRNKVALQDGKDDGKDKNQTDETDKNILDNLKNQKNKEDEDNTSALLRKLMQ
jgi:hypothetical protein